MPTLKIASRVPERDKDCIFTFFAHHRITAAAAGDRVGVEKGVHAWAGDGHELEDIGEEEIECEEESQGWDDVAGC